MTSALLAAPALLLVVAGAAKVAEPRRTAGALAALGWPSSPRLVRAGAAVEVVLGAVGLSYGGVVPALLVAASFAGFAAFVAVALRAGAPIGSCGCFGQTDTPPRVIHLVADVLLAGAAAVAAAAGAEPLVEARWPAWLLAVALAAGAYAALTGVRAGARSGGR